MRRMKLCLIPVVARGSGAKKTLFRLEDLGVMRCVFCWGRIPHQPPAPAPPHRPGGRGARLCCRTACRRAPRRRGSRPPGGVPVGGHSTVRRARLSSSLRSQGGAQSTGSPRARTEAGEGITVVLPGIPCGQGCKVLEKNQ